MKFTAEGYVLVHPRKGLTLRKVKETYRDMGASTDYDEYYPEMGVNNGVWMAGTREEAEAELEKVINPECGLTTAHAGYVVGRMKIDLGVDQLGEQREDQRDICLGCGAVIGEYYVTHQGRRCDRCYRKEPVQ